jgi:hypothetical protein
MANFIGEKVVVTTAHRGVFFGEVLEYDTAAKTITLKDSRVIVYWPAEVRGFIGLAYTGPLTGSRVSPPAPKAQYTDVTGLLACTPEAIRSWESGLWEN